MKDTIEYVRKLREDEGIVISVKNNELDVKAPRGRMTGAILAELKRRKPELLRYLADISVEQNSIKPIENATGNYPISDAQRRLWIVSQFEQASAAYNIPASTYL